MTQYTLSYKKRDPIRYSEETIDTPETDKQIENDINVDGIIGSGW